jgi:hypothetical protein
VAIRKIMIRNIPSRKSAITDNGLSSSIPAKNQERLLRKVLPVNVRIPKMRTAIPRTRLVIINGIHAGWYFRANVRRMRDIFFFDTERNSPNYIH